MCNSLRPRLIPAAALFLFACGTANEQESSSIPASDETRYEIVIVDSSGEEGIPSAVDTPASPPPVPPVMPSAAPLPSPPPVDDEVGGDGLVRYDPQGKYVVQVGVFAALEKARTRVRQLVDLGYPAFLTAAPKHGGTRVRIGFFATRQDAENFGQRFSRDHGSEYWIDRRRAGARGER